MAGKHKKSAQPRPKAPDDPGFPGLGSPTGQAKTTTTTQYEELQENELIALQAIYADDFIEEKAPQSAWKKSEPKFVIRIKAFSDEELSVLLGVVMTATYPKSPPILTLKDHDSLSESTLFKVQKFVETKPKLFCQREEAMIDAVVEGIREILEDAAQAKAHGLVLPSLEEERAAHEAELAKLAQQEKEKEEQKRIEETKEEERVFDGMVQEEMKRQRAKVKEQRKKNRSSQMSPDRSLEDQSDTATLVFDQPCKLVGASGGDSRFNTVVGRTFFRAGPISNIYIVRPVLSAGQHRPNLALKQAELKPSGKDAGQFKKQLQSLESQLELAKKNRHKNILEVMEFRIDRGGLSGAGPVAPSDWTVNVLTPLAERGSLQDLLEMAGHIDVDKVRSWTRDLLEALNFLHANGVVHKSIHPSNVLLFREATGSVIPKLADAGFQKQVHDICLGTRAVASMREAKSAYWFPPEIAGAAKPHYSQKTDIWDFGVMFLQMVFGLDVPQKYHSPKDLKESISLSPELNEMVSNFFNAEPSKRKRAFDLGSHHFLATNAQILAEDTSAILSDSLISLPQISGPRLRHGSINRTAIPSRWAREWIEEGRLGKGGFGEVVKARNVVEGTVYAVKKIRQRANQSLTGVVSEVSVFGKMSHPAVVRYFGAWIEEIHELSESRDGSTSGGPPIEFSTDIGAKIEFTTSHGALDFVSSSRPHIEFGYDSDNDEARTENGDGSGEDDDDDGDDASDSEGSGDSEEDDSSDSETSGRPVVPQRKPSRRQSQRPFRTIMYMVMEYCEKRTLRDLIENKLHENLEEIWRLFRQLLEGLEHIHGWDIVHRDLKPENIFIKVGADGTNMVKIGDFGLATAGMRAVDKSSSDEMDSADMTRSIGTATYLAPEVRSGGKGTYTSKCDMYALGIIFFEMCYPPMLGMQRAKVFEDLRRPNPTLPDDFVPGEKNPRLVVLALVTHNPDQRPSATELLKKSGLLPVEMESDAMRQVMAGLSDPSNQHYHDYISALFKRPIDQAKDYTWDMAFASKGPGELMQLHAVKDALISIFRRHGAVEVPRGCLYPPSSLYIQNTVQVVDKHGALLQLPYDLMMGNARVLSKCTTPSLVQRSYSFGTVFRDRAAGGQPNMFGEVHFDVVTADTSDMALKEAEAVKVLDEIIGTFPSLSSGQMCFHLGHSDLLRLIFAHCGVEPAARRSVADTLSKLNIRGVGWQKIKSELRSSAGVSATTVDELQRFDFRDTPSKVISQLKTIFQGTSYYQQVSPTLAHLKEVSEYCKRLGVRTKIYVNPLWSWNEVFFGGGIMFSCLFDKRSREVFAAGGRYDALIKEHRPRISTQFEERHAVGFGLNWEKLAHAPKPTGSGRGARGKASAGAADEEAQGGGAGGVFAARRCDVLVASFDPTLLRTAGIDILQGLWAHDVSAELARDARSPEELLTKHRDEGHHWVVIVKQDSLKVKTPGRRDAPDVDVPPSQLVSWLRSEMRERDARATAAAAAGAVRARGNVALVGGGGGSGGSGGSGGGGGGVDYGSYGGGHYHSRHHDPHHSFQYHQYSYGSSSLADGAGGGGEQDVRVLVAQTRSKKFNRQAVVEQAQAASSRLVSSFRTGPVVAVETSDAVMDLVRTTSLSDPESWRRAEQAVGMVERKYLREVREVLEGFKAEWVKGRGEAGELSGGGGSGGGGGGTGGSGQGGGGSGNCGSPMPAFVYNFRTGSCIYYDLGP